jgi:signal transduction histidine kinase
MTDDTPSRFGHPHPGWEPDALESAAQTLEAIASGLVGDETKVRDVARAEARRLRSSFEPVTNEGELAALLAGLTAEFAEVGLVVEYSTSVIDLGKGVGDVLRDVLAEALSDVVRVSEARTAIVRAAKNEDGITMTVRDYGAHLGAGSQGIRLRPSRALVHFLEVTAGTVSIWSVSGRGTRVSLFVPH